MTKNLIEKDKDFLPKLLHIALPISFQSLMLASVAAADAFMLGSYTQDSMSAVSLATQWQFIQNMFIMSITAIEGILGAQYWGKGDKESLNKIFRIALKLTGIISVIFWALCFFIPEPLMAFYTDQPALIEAGCRYLRIASWSYLISGFSQTYLTMMKVSDHPGRTATISSCIVVINILLNAVFIFGLFGIKKMGVEGAALATLISRVIELIWCVANSYRKNYIHPDFTKIFVTDRLLFGDYFKLMMPILGASLLWGVGFSSYSMFMGHLGSDATGANSVAAVIRDLLCCFCNGLCSAASIVVGNELGAGNLEKGKAYGERILKIGLVMSAILSLVLFALTPALIHIGKLTDNARQLLLGMLLINSVYMYGRSLNTILINGVIDGGGDTIFDLYSLAICMWGIAIPLAALGTYVFHWHVLVVYACTCIDEVGKIPWVIIRFKKYKWVKDLTR